VYVDARGVTRKALIKGAAKGMLFKAKVGNDDEVVLGGERVESLSVAPPSYLDSKSSSASAQNTGVVQDTSSYSGLNHPGAWGQSKERKEK